MYIEMYGELAKSDTKNDCYGYNDCHIKKVRKQKVISELKNYGHSDKCLNDREVRGQKATFAPW